MPYHAANFNRLEIGELAEIPQPNRVVLRCSCKYIAILREGNCGDRASVALKVVDVAVLLDVPDSDKTGVSKIWRN